ncbi:hypothetical protein SLT36_31620 (plasmid) [Aminobacter sp. BA135]
MQKSNLAYAFIAIVAAAIIALFTVGAFDAFDEAKDGHMSGNRHVALKLD